MQHPQFSKLAFSVAAVLTLGLAMSGRIFPELPLLSQLLTSEFGTIFSLAMIWWNLKHYRQDKQRSYLVFSGLHALMLVHFIWYGGSLWYQAASQLT